MEKLKAEEYISGKPMRYRVQDRGRLREKYKTGTVVKIEKTNEDGRKDQRHPGYKTCTVLEQYTFIALCVDDSGNRECFNYFELDQERA